VGLRIDPTRVKDPAPLEWWAGRVVSGPSVRSWMPDVFERYARILHPAHMWEAAADGVVTRPVPWKDVSAWSGKPLHGTSSIHDLAQRDDGASWDRQGGSLPQDGQLEPPYLDRLTEVLAEASSTPEVLWLLVWYGYGRPVTYAIAEPGSQVGAGPSRRRSRLPRKDLDPDTIMEINPTWAGSGRRYFLHRGSIERSSRARGRSMLEEPPSFWWPADRAWFVSTDIDSSSTYVGGASALIDQLIAHELLEVFPADLDDPYDGPSYDPEPRGGVGGR
jgi:hypothetical protein